MIKARKDLIVKCAKGCIDKTPNFMAEREKIISLIDKVYKKHGTERLETPVFELREIYSNKMQKCKGILELEEHGGEKLVMRYDLKAPLTRYLAMHKIDKHMRLSQFGYIYRNDMADYEQLRLKEFFVSDYDICGPSDVMLSEVQCLRVACELLTVLYNVEPHCSGVSHMVGEPYCVRIGHRQLTESCLRVAANVSEDVARQVVSKLAMESRRSMIDWGRASLVVGDKRISDSSWDRFRTMVEIYSGGDLTTMLAAVCENMALGAMKGTRTVFSDMTQLERYCKFFLTEADYGKLRLDLSLVGPSNYYTGLTFAGWLSDTDKNVLSGGRYDNLIKKINPKSKFSTSCTGFTVGIDQIVMDKLAKRGTIDLLLSLENGMDVGDGRDWKNGRNGEIEGIMERDKKKEKKEECNKWDDNVMKNVKGTVDKDNKQIRNREKILAVIVNCFKRHNADNIDTPVMERKDILIGQYGDDSKLIYDLSHAENEEPLSLRYDLTVPLARYLAMHPDLIGPQKLFKRYQIGNVYRRDHPSMNNGRYREFSQCDFDIVGDNGEPPMTSDAECLTIVHDILRDLGLGDFKIKINHRRFLDGLLAVCGVPDTMFRTVCSSIDKLDKRPWTMVQEELLKKGLSDETVKKIGHYVCLSGSGDLIERLEQDQDLSANENVRVALAEMRLLFGHCPSIMDKVVFDVSLARGLEYYTGIIFEAVFVGFESTIIRDDGGDTNGSVDEETNIGVGSVVGGGRYDNLVNVLTESAGVDTRCVGLSFGVERLMTISDKKRIENNGGEGGGGDDGESGGGEDRNLVVVVMSAQRNMVHERLKLLAMLLDAGITAVHSMKKNARALDVFQDCSRHNIQWAVIIGEDELALDSVKLRHIETRREEMIRRTDIVTRLKAELGL